MASISYIDSKKLHRIFYRLKVNGELVDKAKYAKQKSRANQLKTQIGQLESATRIGIAATEEIELWVERGWIKQEEAEEAFPGLKETASRQRRGRVETTDYDAILDAYEEYAMDDMASHHETEATS